jgi:hypothetical protein
MFPFLFALDCFSDRVSAGWLETEILLPMCRVKLGSQAWITPAPDLSFEWQMTTCQLDKNNAKIIWRRRNTVCKDKFRFQTVWNPKYK